METREFKFELGITKSNKWNQVVYLLLVWEFGEKKIYWKNAVDYICSKLAVIFTKEDKDQVKWLKKLTDWYFNK